MWTTSTVTALAAQDYIPGDKVDILNCMCVLVLTRDNGTPFNATSIQEKDIIEICIQLGQTHPKGVLWYSAVELVILFQSMKEMLVMACGVIKAMVFHEEPIRLRMSPHLPPMCGPSWQQGMENHQAPSLQPLKGGKFYHPLMTPTWEGGPHINYLGDLVNAELWQLMEDLCQEVTLRELNVPPGTHCQSLGEIHWEMGILMWMIGRSPFQEGEGGNPEDNHFDPLLSPNWMKM